MFLLVFMGVSLFVCFIWAFVLLKRILYMNSDEVLSMSNDVPANSGSSPSKALFTEATLKQLMPITSDNWVLNRVLQQHRVWHRRTHEGIKLYAVTMKVKASAQILSNFIRRMTAFKEWRPGIVLCEMVSENGHRQTIKWRQRKLTHRLLASDNVISWWLEPLLEDELSVDRVFLSGASYMGLVETVELYGESTAYICQPIIGLENDQCRLTVISHGGDIHRLTDECQCLSDHFLTMRAPTEANQTYTQYNTNSNNGQRDGEHGDKTGTNNNASGEPPGPQSNFPESAGPQLNGVDDFSDSHSDLSDEEEDNSNHSRFRVGGSLQDSQSDNDKDKSARLDNSSVNLTDSVRKRPKLLKSASVTNPRVDVFQSSGKSHSEDVTSISQASSNNLDMSTQNGSRTEVVSGSNVVFLRTISSENQGGLVDYKTLSNKCAADLLAEVLEAGNIVQRPPVKDRNDAVPLQGWVFESTDRDVAILQKLDPNNLKLQSWLGKGLIKETPDTVWEAIVNPYTRCIHDDMLKEVTVISDLGNGMKLLRLFYSTSQIIRRDNREFYLLQAERIEGKKRILTLRSVDWPESESKDCPRGKIDLVDYTSPGTQQFEEEFVTKQPNAISDLRNYLSCDLK